MKLYWGSGSPPCMKVIMVLEEKEQWASCDEKQIKFFPDKEHKGPEVMKTNPRGQVSKYLCIMRLTVSSYYNNSPADEFENMQPKYRNFINGSLIIVYKLETCRIIEKY